MSAAAPLLAKKLKVALLQLAAGANKAANLKKVEEYATQALSAHKDVDLIMLPECFNSPYAVEKFREYSEQIPQGETSQFLSALAKKLNVIIVGGSIPEIEGDKVYNTSLTFNASGKIIAKHRKVHLFDIDIPNGITFKESVTLSPGNKATSFQLPAFGQVGLGICYDIRFPELAAISARKNNAFAMLYPGAFNTTTGPLHWHLLARARAIDNEIFVVLCSPARDPDPSVYQAYGHSLVVDPYGKVIAEAGEGEEIVYCELDPELIPKVREGIPVTFQRRFDVYDDVGVTAKVSDL
ncbi:hypothetical protein BABINDRAFT_161178 [Babjeviella inositovora NRRL Y-12698]|uniref:CN hydrolase domain-containing protein n=1 Tax=Babjeviella inositovora NRRL Y-12698 TaxID=984486 RepID=A0A1E3QRT2_9ASCO|nr:uncharacterized protein BABINDRAFT_161178 [Babjeviella inositovora NRRL Y-12698]ODQ80204.1 hypothetical protein BABINDRAFT_161178 [Babjeviella inositovora NRRL Y-12698]